MQSLFPIGFRGEVTAPTVQAAEKPVAVLSINELARANAEHYHVNPSHLIKTMECESRGNDEAVGDHGKAYGLMQFHQTTFNWMKGLAIKAGEPFENLSYKDPESQLKLAAWAFAHGYAGHWSCYKIKAAKGWT